MYFRVFLLFLFLFAYSVESYSQITIEDCYRLAEQNYPQIKKSSLIEKSLEYNIKNANMGYVPKIVFSGRASYQSDVTKIPFDFPGIPVLSKDQYKVSVDIVQPIWDGGKIESDKSKIKAESDVERDALNVQLYSLKYRINQLYFGILLIDEQIKQNDIYTKNLNRSYKIIKSSVKNGVAGKSDLDRIELELIKAKQSRVQLETGKNSYKILLETMINSKIDDNDLVKPLAYEPIDYTINRPELKLFESQLNALEAGRSSIKSSYMPTFDLFFTAGYGKPGLDMLQDSFQPYYIAGIQMQWQLMGLYRGDKNSKLIDLNKMNINVEKETFLFNVNQDIKKQKNEIKRIKDLIKYDNEIIKLRENIRKTSEVKVQEGTMTVNEYLQEVSAENLAVQEKLLHEIELINAVYELNYIINK